MATVGAVLSAMVVTLNVSDTPPIVSVASVVVLKLPDDVCCTVTVSPLVTVPAFDVYAPVLTLYAPTVIDIFAAVLIPATVISSDVIRVFNATSVWSVNVNWSGDVSGAGSVVKLHG